MWEQIHANRRRSIGLIVGMVVVLLALGYTGGELMVGRGGGVLGLGLAAVIWGILMAVYLTSAESILLTAAGARPLTRDDSPRLFNIVDEMVLASGLGYTPRLYLIDESAPNAFAVGRKPERAAVAVTAGLMHRLNRDELQGVIAHEIAHLKNQDVKFMTLAAVLLGSIIVLSEVIRRSLWYGGRGRRRSSSRGSGGGGGQAQVIILIVGLVFAILGPVLAQILYFACSRKREFLADASAAQLTRYPEGLASALEKIAGASRTMESVTRATAPMYIVNPLYAGRREPSSVFSSHPPTTERVRILRSMAGASLLDYEMAYRRARSGTAIGERTLEKAAPIPLRPPSADTPPDGPATRDAVYRSYGYLRLKCGCGLEMSVPERYERNEIHCIRCGSTLPLPAVTAVADTAAARAKAPPVPAAPGEPPLEYRRTGTGWESFRCRCGRTVQLSPAFSAPQIRCQACGRQITVS